MEPHKIVLHSSSSIQPSDSNLHRRVGFLEGVLLSLEFASTYEEFRATLERANERYKEIRDIEQ